MRANARKGSSGVEGCGFRLQGSWKMRQFGVLGFGFLEVGTVWGSLNP